MSYTIRNLVLYQPLLFCLPRDDSPCGSNTPYTEKLTMYTSAVTERDLEPCKTDHLLNGVFCGYGIVSAESESDVSAIPPGRYLFTQGIFTGFDAVLEAAEELWLESLWLEVSLEGQTVYVRELEEEGMNVFQIFRPIQSGSADGNPSETPRH